MSLKTSEITWLTLVSFESTKCRSLTYEYLLTAREEHVKVNYFKKLL
jgi:hypothetical protein